jgi:hypothetical protein
VFLACVLGAFLLDVFWRERADWLLVNAASGRFDLASHPSGVSYGRELECARSRPLRTYRQLTLLQMTYTVQTARLVLGGGAG